MTPADFAAFVALMKERGLSKGDIATRLGKPASRISDYLRDGTDQTMALACAALAAGLKPWPAHRRSTKADAAS
jgi:transcriptional regulator with XRE-family HTH domain